MLHSYFNIHILKVRLDFNGQKTCLHFDSIWLGDIRIQEQNTFITSPLIPQIQAEATHYHQYPPSPRKPTETWHPVLIFSLSSSALWFHSRSERSCVILLESRKIRSNNDSLLGAAKCPEGLGLAQVIPSQGSRGGEVPEGQISSGKSRLPLWGPGAGSSGFEEHRQPRAVQS